MKKIKKRDVVFIAAIVLSVVIVGLIIDQNLKETDDNQLGELKYNITEIQEDSLSGMTYGENDEIVRKTYTVNKGFLEINVDIAPYDTYEAAVSADNKYEYLEYHHYSENNAPGIEKIICGVVNGDREYRGAMAWIYTNCGTYTILVKSITRNYSKCEEMLHIVLGGTSVD